MLVGRREHFYATEQVQEASRKDVGHVKVNKPIESPGDKNQIYTTIEGEFPNMRPTMVDDYLSEKHVKDQVDSEELR